jgi:hypothetical protein
VEATGEQMLSSFIPFVATSQLVSTIIENTFKKYNILYSNDKAIERIILARIIGSTIVCGISLTILPQAGFYILSEKVVRIIVAFTFASIKLNSVLCAISNAVETLSNRPLRTIQP